MMEQFKVRSWCCNGDQTEFEMKYDCPFILRQDEHRKYRADDRAFFYYNPAFSSLIAGYILNVMLFTGVYDKTKWEELPEAQMNFWMPLINYDIDSWQGIPIFEGDYIRVLSQQLPKKTELQHLYHKEVVWNPKTCGFNITMSQPNHQGFKVLGNKYEGMIYEQESTISDEAWNKAGRLARQAFQKGE